MQLKAQDMKDKKMLLGGILHSPTAQALSKIAQKDNGIRLLYVHPMHGMEASVQNNDYREKYLKGMACLLSDKGLASRSFLLVQGQAELDIARAVVKEYALKQIAIPGARIGFSRSGWITGSKLQNEPPMEKYSNGEMGRFLEGAWSVVLLGAKAEDCVGIAASDIVKMANGMKIRIIPWISNVFTLGSSRLQGAIASGVGMD